jgi:hypothetical protein
MRSANFILCYLVNRMRRPCDYSEPVATTDDLQSRIRELEELIAQLSDRTPSTSTSYESIRVMPIVNRTPSQTLSHQSVFLDPEISEYCNTSVVAADLPPPHEVSEFLGSPSNITIIKLQYFQSVNTWMPIINKSKLDRLTDGTHKELRADVVLLLLCMKLVHEVPLDTYVEESSLYVVIKRFSFTLDMAGIYSLLKLQASLLIAVYELGHAILPAAYRTIGDCARQGITLGIHDILAPQMLRKPRSWLDWEERQRVWWLVVILDRLGGDSISCFFLLTVT